MDIDRLLEGVPLKLLKKGFAELSSAYRQTKDVAIDTREKALAYLVYRTPATVAVIERVFREIAQHRVHSFCDVGAGFGSGYLACRERFADVAKATLLERSPLCREIGSELLASDVHWRGEDFTNAAFEPHDLFLFSYSLNEVSLKNSLTTLSRAWDKTNKFLCIIEPGTPEGYKRVLAYREHLIAAGGFVIAPCPHNKPCPLQQGDWCHFSQRVQRSAAHRYIKGGTLGFEDEKFSYIIVGKAPQAHSPRILTPPVKWKNGVRLRLCTERGIEERNCSKKECKKKGWGDLFY